jgi:ubiquinone/menaquinone biosynthesis C-methylase UbiE
LTKKLHKKHEHSGKSSKKILNAKKVIGMIGLEKGGSFLDVGCGDGYFSLEASKMVGKEGKVYALDVDDIGISSLRNEVSKKNIQNIEPIIADITGKIPLNDGIIDVCFMANVIHGFVENNEVENVFREVNRVLKPNGKIAVVEFKKNLGIAGPPRSIRLSPEELEKALGTHGFRKDKVVKAGFFNYLAIFYGS